MSGNYFEFKYFTKDAQSFPESLLNEVDEHTKEKYPFINTYIEQLIEDTEVEHVIETYDELVEYFVDTLGEEEDEVDDLPLFKEMNKQLKKDFDIVIGSIEYCDVARDFLLSVNHLKEIDD
jgi:hypothetical protein